MIVRGLRPLLGLLLVLGSWQFWAIVMSPDSIILPPPTRIASYGLSHSGDLLSAGSATLKVVLLGFAIAVCLALVLTITFELVPVLRDMFLPLLVVTQVTPTIAVAPLLVIGLGFGSAPKIAIVILISFFPILVGTLAGVREVSADLEDFCLAVRAKRWRTLRYVALPNSVPYFFSGARVAITLAVIGAVVGEFVAADAGLGYLILQGSAQIRPEMMWAGVLSLAIMGLALFNLVRLVEWVALPWKRS